MIDKIRNYFINQGLITEDNVLNVEFLGNEPEEFSLVTINVNPILETFINGDQWCQFQFQLVSRNVYGPEVIMNVQNSTFYETLRNKIQKLNKAKTWPDIPGIDGIECLECGAIATATPNTAQYSILMRITYYKEAE